MKEKIIHYLSVYHEIIEKKENPTIEVGELPGNVYFVGDDIVALPRVDGDSRYPYGEDGFNYWTYASGYIHCNEGLFSPFLRASEGSEPKISFFVGIKEEDEVSLRYSAMSVPELSNEPDQLNKFTVFSKDGAYYISESKDLITGIFTTVIGRKIYYSFVVINKQDKPLHIFTSSYFNPFLKNALAENSTDRWFRQLEYVSGKHVPGKHHDYFKLETYEEKDRGIMATNYGLIKRFVKDAHSMIGKSTTTSRYEYVGGTISSLHNAKAINEGCLTNQRHQTSFTETAICGDILDFNVEDSIRIDYEFSYSKNDKEFNQLLQSEFDGNVIDGIVGKIENTGSKVPLKIEFEQSIIEEKLSSKAFNPFMIHLKKQVEFCSEIKGFVQLSNFSLIGIRDIFQAIEGYLYFEPEKAKSKMLEALSFASPDGRLPRQYSLPKSENESPAMDLRPFIDQGVWVISTILTYIRFTKDYTLLSEECGYYDIVDEDKHLVAISKTKDSVLMHMIRIMDYLLINRDHQDTKCVLALYGDWNDALDGLGKSMDADKEYGSGVSVMATLQVYQNLSEMAELIGQVEKRDWLHDETGIDFEYLIELTNSYKKAKEEIKTGLFENALLRDRIVHGWGDKRSYFVGSLNDPDSKARDGLTSNAFWVLSGLIKEDDYKQRKEMILNAYERLGSKFGLKTFEPYFEKGTHGVGRIPNLPKGTAENGATYIHASMFGVMSLFAIGESRLAWDELIRLMPITHESISVSPYVVPNSYGLNETFNIDGESMQDWQTGSSNVMFKLILRYIFGFEPTEDGILIQPSNYQPFKKQELTINYMNKSITLIHIKDKNELYTREFSINGQPFNGAFDSVMLMDRLFISDQTIRAMDDTIKIVVKDK